MQYQLLVDAATVAIALRGYAMKIILLKELKGRGGEGDVIDVADGFANNFLLPQKIAIKATKGNLKQLEQSLHNIKLREEERLGGAEEFKKVLEAGQIVISARVGDEGHLFGSVTSTMIAEAVQEQMGLEIDKKRINLAHPIKMAGETVVSISLYREIKANLTVNVVSEDEDTTVEEAVVVEETIVAVVEDGEVVAVEDEIVITQEAPADSE